MGFVYDLQGYPHGPQGHHIGVLHDIHERHGLRVPDELPPLRSRDAEPTAEEKALCEAWNKRELQERAQTQARVREANTAAIARTANAIARLRARVLSAETPGGAGRILQEAFFVPSDLSIEVWLRWSAPGSGSVLELVAFEAALPRTFNLHVTAGEVGSVITGPHSTHFRHLEQLRVGQVRTLDVPHELWSERVVYVTPAGALLCPVPRTAEIVLYHGRRVLFARPHTEEPASRWSVVRVSGEIDETSLARCIADRLRA